MDSFNYIESDARGGSKLKLHSNLSGGKKIPPLEEEEEGGQNGKREKVK